MRGQIWNRASPILSLKFVGIVFIAGLKILENLEKLKEPIVLYWE
jgi:hypothetical protein